MKRLAAVLGIAFVLMGVRLYDTGLYRFTPDAKLTNYSQSQKFFDNAFMPNGRDSYRIDIDKDTVSIKELIDMYEADIVFTEMDGNLIYAFSAVLPFFKKVNGKRINVMIYLGQSQINVGVPILKGSY